LWHFALAGPVLLFAGGRAERIETAGSYHTTCRCALPFDNIASECYAHTNTIFGAGCDSRPAVMYSRQWVAGSRQTADIADEPLVAGH
jgi:hypothetical protein